MIKFFVINISNSDQDKKKSTNLDENDLLDWSEKFDSSLQVLSNEYVICIETIKNIDEKANKYLTAISIFVAGIFAILPSSSMDNLSFKYPMTLVDFLSFSFIAFFTVGGIYCFRSIFYLLKSMDFIETRRMPDLKLKLEENGVANAVEYKHVLILCYQEAINFMQEQIYKKQSKIRIVLHNLHYAIIFSTLSFLMLFIIKLVSKL